jgi:trk system potassium uptake protein TrkH
MKNVRVLLLLKHAKHQIFRHIHPRGVRLLKIDRKTVPDPILQGVLGFFALYIALFTIGSFVMAGLGLDFVTAGASVLACLSNVGPGLGEVGPTDTYATIPKVGKVVLAMLMLLGRLEIFTVLVLFFPSFWRK